MELKGKKILILSPCKWSDFQVSKHHYARELSSLGNEILFVEWPNFNTYKESTIRKLDKNVSVFTLNTWMPKALFFHLPTLYSLIIGFKLRKIASDCDIIWSFDGSTRLALKFFKNLKSKFKIFHPVDIMPEEQLLSNAKFADISFSCSYEIVSILKNNGFNSFFINHGVASYYLNKPYSTESKKNIKFGFVGNIAAPQLDLKSLLEIVKKNRNINFIFWGKNELDSNMPISKRNLLTELGNQLNVHYKGILHPRVLSDEIQVVDGFLFCYDMRFQNRGNNSHKMLEYLSTGKLIVSSLLIPYQKFNDEILMSNFDDNRDFIELFDFALENITKLNHHDLAVRRKKIALANSYEKQIKRIESYIK